MGDFRNRNNKRMSRSQFEALIHGEWEKVADDRIRRNGKFSTYVRGQWKFLSNGQKAVRAKTWAEIAEVLEKAK